MRETEPFQPITTEPLPPPDAVTIELTADEIREALCAYIGGKRGERFTGHAYVGVRAAPGSVEIRVTYWKTGPPEVNVGAAKMKQDATEVAPSGLVKVVRPMTPLERSVAERVRDGVDPWLGNFFGGSRKVSHALGRLRRKGFVNYGYLPKPRENDVGYFLTELGVSWLGGGKDPRE
jgi:hypothetical protein